MNSAQQDVSPRVDGMLAKLIEKPLGITLRVAMLCCLCNLVVAYEKGAAVCVVGGEYAGKSAIVVGQPKVVQDFDFGKITVLIQSHIPCPECNTNGDRRRRTFRQGSLCEECRPKGKKDCDNFSCICQKCNRTNFLMQEVDIKDNYLAAGPVSKSVVAAPAGPPPGVSPMQANKTQSASAYDNFSKPNCDNTSNPKASLLSRNRRCLGARASSGRRLSERLVREEERARRC